MFLPLLAALPAARAASVLVDRVAAVVGDQVITLTEVYDLGGDYIEERAAGEGPDGPKRRAAELEVLDELVRRALVAQEVENLDLEVTEEELDRAILDIARQNGMDVDRLRREVERSGVDWEVYRGELRQNLRELKFQQTVILPRVTVTEDEVRDRYNREVAGRAGAELRRLQGILLPFPPGADEAAREEVRRRARRLAARLAAGEPWEEVAAAAPDSPYAAAGTDMGTYREGELLDALDEVAFSLGVGEVGGPVELPGGVALLRVAGIEHEAPEPFEAVRPRLEEELRREKADQQVDLWAAQVRRRTPVTILLEPPG